MKGIAPLTCAFSFLAGQEAADAGGRDGVRISVSTQLDKWVQSGYQADLSFLLPGRMEIGLALGGSDVGGRAKGVVLDVDGDDSLLDLRMQWSASLVARYRLTASRGGFWLGLSTGVEEFRTRELGEGGDVFRDRNGFVVPIVGFRWYPFTERGVFLQPQVGGIIIVSRSGERRHVDTTYRLRPFFPSAALSLGWTF